MFFTTLAQYAPPSYGDGYVYSTGAKNIGILVGLLPIFLMTAVAMNIICRSRGTFSEVKKTQQIRIYKNMNKYK